MPGQQFGIHRGFLPVDITPQRFATKYWSADSVHLRSPDPIQLADSRFHNNAEKPTLTTTHRHHKPARASVAFLNDNRSPTLERPNASRRSDPRDSTSSE